MATQSDAERREAESSNINSNELLKAAKGADAYNDVDITDAKTKIVEYIARNPSATNRDVASSTGCSMSYPSRVRDQLNNIIIARAEELGTDLTEFEESDERRQQKRAEDWGSLTDKQREVLRRLATEDSPRNPDASLRDIVADLSELPNSRDFNTDPSYVSNVMEKYGEFAVKLSHARDQASDDQDPESLVDEIELDETDSDEPVNTTSDDVNTTETPRNDTLEELLEFVQEQKEMANMEVENGAQSDISVGRLTMAEQVESRIQEAVTDVENDGKIGAEIPSK